MSTSAIIVIVVVVVVVALAAALFVGQWRRHRLRSRLHRLSAESRQAYETEWARVQERFVDAPTDAVAEADRLVTALLAERGYPTGEFDQRAADLSVDHADVVDGYRSAHGMLDGHSDETDDLRRALLDYRSVLVAVLKTSEPHDTHV